MISGNEKFAPASMQYSMDALFDVVVVGASVEGSSTAYHLARRGSNEVLLLEQVRQLYTHTHTNSMQWLLSRFA